jgi:hypothetical protein
MKLNFIVKFKDKYLLVILSNKLLLKQMYIKNKIYTLFFILHLLYKYGILNRKYN